MKIKEMLLRNYLAWSTRPGKLSRYWRGQKIRRTSNLDNINPQEICVGAIQLELNLMQDVSDYQDEMQRFTAKAAREGVQLLVFPENNTFQLLGLIPGIEKLAAAATSSEENPDNVTVADLFRLAGPFFNRVAQDTFSTLAKSYGVYIMGGSFPVPVDQRVMNRALLYGPDGQVVGTQDKVHLMPLERSWGLSAGDAFHVFPTPLGTLAMPVCMDATFFETFRMLAGLGADIVMVPIANAESYNEWLALRGIWPRVQETMVYGVKSAMFGNLLGHTLTGKAGVFAPMALTPNKDGVLAEAENPDTEGFVRAYLDLPALHALRRNHPYLGDKNPALEKKYFPHIYTTTR